VTRFSVILPTRNRPGLFRQALGSVLAQSDADFDIVVVNDGSDPMHAAGYGAIEAGADARTQFLALARRSRGHGPSYALNTGAAHARGDYLCFLDDDDLWTDPSHLSRATRAIALAGDLDLFMTDQVAWSDGVIRPPPIWIEDLLARAPDLPGPDASGCYAATPDVLLRAHGFCHLNTLIVRRAFFLELGGLDEELRYESDRDFYLRAIDRATTIRYSPFKVALHNVPVSARAANMSTMVSTAEKRLCQLRLLDKQMLSARSPEIRQYAWTHKAYTLQKLADELADAGLCRMAARYAREALAVRPSARWLAMTIMYGARSLMSRIRSNQG
jgi:glycosyltransferase involved in cell wall biosynthesis